MRKKQSQDPKQIMHTLALGDVVTVLGETGVITQARTIHGPGRHINVELLLVEHQAHSIETHHACTKAPRRGCDKCVTKCHVKSEPTTMSKKNRPTKKYVKKNRPYGETLQGTTPPQF